MILQVGKWKTITLSAADHQTAVWHSMVSAAFTHCGWCSWRPKCFASRLSAEMCWASGNQWEGVIQKPRPLFVPLFDRCAAARELPQAQVTPRPGLSQLVWCMCTSNRRSTLLLLRYINYTLTCVHSHILASLLLPRNNGWDIHRNINESLIQ